MWLHGPQDLAIFWAAVSSHKKEAESELEQPGHKTDARLGCWCYRQRLSALCHGTSLSPVVFKAFGSAFTRRSHLATLLR